MFMRHLTFTLACLMLAVLALAGCGDQSATFAFQRLTLTQIQQVNPPMGINQVGLIPEPVIITGGDFTNIVGTTVEVRWATKDSVDITLPGPTILHSGERDWTSTSGYVTSPTTIEAVSPALDIPCDLMITGNINGCVQVFLASNAYSDPLVIPGLFLIPNPATFAFNITSAPACEPVPFTLTGTNFTPVGGTVVLHWVDPTMSGAFDGLDETTTHATITSDTTIEGLTPNVVLCGPNGASDLTIEMDQLEWVNEPICISIDPPLTLLIEAPDLTSIDYRTINLPVGTYAAGYATGELPSTYLEHPTTLDKLTTMEGFTITGTGFGPTGASALVTFTDPAGTAVFDATGASSVTVSGLVIDSTTIQGTVPGINEAANRLLANAATDVLVELEDGCCVSQTGFATFRAPPTPNNVVNTEAGTAGGTGDGFFTAATPNEIFACHSFLMDVEGINFTFHPLRLALYVTEAGITRRIGTGTPPSIVADIDIGFTFLSCGPTLVQGHSRIDGGLGQFDADANGLVGATVRLTNADGQCGEFAFDYDVIGRQVNRSNTGTVINSNVDVTIDPTSTTGGANTPPTPHDFGASTNDATAGANLAVAYENDTTDQSASNSFSGTSLIVDWSRDGGVTWNRTTIDAGVDGLPAAAVRSFPQVKYDAFGNLWLSYLVDDFTGAAGTETSRVMLFASFDQGASFGAGGAIATTAAGDGGLYFEPSLAVGVDAVTGTQAAFVAWVDATQGLPTRPDRVVVAGRSTPAFGAIGAAYPVTPVDSVVPGPGVFFRSHATPAVGPDGELYVSWVEPDFSGFPPVSDIRINVDADGFLAGSSFGMDSVAAADIEFPLLPPPSQPDAGRLIPLQDMEVIQTGPKAGRVIIAYEGTSISSGLINPTFLHVITTYSDTFGLSWNDTVVHQVDTADQFLPELATDPVTGDVYVTWYDTKNSAPINNLAERWIASSLNGATWGGPLLVSDGQSAQAAGDEEAVEYGVWAGLAVWNGCILSGWADTADNGGESDAVVKLLQMFVAGK